LRQTTWIFESGCGDGILIREETLLRRKRLAARARDRPKGLGREDNTKSKGKGRTR
jgi:hypothetical protein